MQQFLYNCPRSEVMKIPLVKLKAILLYFANNTDPKYLGKVKLMKLLYFLDFMHLKKYGTPVTYDTYIHLEHGPIPSAIKNLIDTADDDLDASALADTIHFEHPKGTKMSRILPNRKFAEKDRKLFSESELDILEKVSRLFRDKNTQYVEKVSHKEAPWNKTAFLDKIPYELAAEDPDSDFDKEDITLALKVL